MPYALRPVLKPVLRPPLRSLFDYNYGAFDPRSLFRSGQLGLWYDPSDMATLYQDSVGTTAVTAVEQPIGLLLDKSRGLVRGPELVTNGDFATQGPWVTESGWSITGGAAVANITTGSLYQNTGLLPNKSYEVSCSVTVTSGSIASNVGGLIVGAAITASGNHTEIVNSGPSGGAFLYFYSPGNAFVGSIDNVSCKLLAGNHASQATAAARPLLSARVNLMTKTEQLDDTGAWQLFNGATTTARQVTFVTASSVIQSNSIPVLPQGNYILSVKLSCATAQTLKLALVDVADGDPSFYSSMSVTSTPTVFTVTGNFAATFSGYLGCQILGNGTIAAGSIVTVHEIQIERGSVATRYQRVNTATDYDTAGFPVYDSFDSIDDALSTGAITLGADMDCFVALKRNSNATTVLISNSTDSNLYCVVLAVGGTGIASNATGSPTYTVDGVAVTGGVNATRGALDAALSLAQWHVIEVRNADFSGWGSGLKLAGYAGLPFPGQIGGIVLCPAQSAASRNQIRTYLGAKVGLTL